MLNAFFAAHASSTLCTSSLSFFVLFLPRECRLITSTHGVTHSERCCTSRCCLSFLLVTDRIVYPTDDLNRDLVRPLDIKHCTPLVSVLRIRCSDYDGEQASTCVSCVLCPVCCATSFLQQAPEKLQTVGTPWSATCRYECPCRRKGGRPRRRVWEGRSRPRLLGVPRLSCYPVPMYSFLMYSFLLWLCSCVLDLTFALLSALLTGWLIHRFIDSFCHLFTFIHSK